MQNQVFTAVAVVEKIALCESSPTAGKKMLADVNDGAI
jgi:hypothetical protein